ncbi:MAG: polyprenyl synthetase family protein [Bacteroidia bacterium]|nr:polyprenyl synthetase family protein [Bacteroidota bacterium]MBP9789809.1 polyprenyl synthetase family protein [Bacteroidia bacterium]MBK7431472.1 polyprenyl synthetase family protein [Bacteroidota bacterium]MBK8587376.1 polyprenyl synthetase family protein [Bacteroidota bacterium]MBP9922738.1 polyprenyl synthetase family protein [Bacteroidia bacterium]
MSQLDEIKAPISSVMDEFENKFRASMKSQVPLLDRITHYIVKRKGKQMRPMFVFLSAGLCGGINETTHRAATLIELLHTATLVHDDVVDDSNERRGFFSINALWKNKIAVLVGDYLLSKGLLLSVQHKDFNFLSIVSEAVRVMSEGELLQIEKARKLDINEEIYYEIIRQKTASLIASCCASGAASAGSSDEEIKKMHEFGELIGMAFQIKDDLFDYGPDGVIGKPTGIDIKESKMTLPLIYSLMQADRSTKRNIVNIIKNHNTEDKKVKEVIAFVKKSGGMEYATEKMKAYQAKAFVILDTFPDSIFKNSLRELVKYTTERNH